MKKFEQKLEEMIESFFNINLYGPSGCGKTSLINRVFRSESKIYVKFNLSDFYSKKNVFYLISNNINKYLNSKSKRQKKHIENINKWYDLYQALDSFSNSALKIYLIIDNILDMESFNYYKKELIKFFVAISSCQNTKIILISNFDITNSEIQYDYDFSSFISIQFPVLTNDELKNIIDKECYSKYYEINRYNELVSTCINNFQYNFSNLNEIIFNVKQNLNLFDNIHTDSKMTELLKKANYNKKKSKKKGNEDNKDEDIEMEDNQDVDDELDIESNINVEEDENKSEDSSENQKKYEKDIYTYTNHAKNNGIIYNQNNLRINIKKQVHYAPIHLMKLDSFFKKKQQDIIGIIDEDENFDNNNNNTNTNNHIKNLTESLSKSQKILLLASYIASETSSKNDKSLFKYQKNRNSKKLHRKNKNFGLNLKSNVGYPFNVNRLTAIYQSLLKLINQEFEDDDIMLKCEIATLAKLGLIRALSSFDSKAIDQKYFTGINLDFALKISEDYDIQLDDFIKYEKID